MSYTAHIHWISPKHIVVASGTAFGEIIVWSCFGDESSSGTAFGSLRKVTHYDFPAHDGSVFGIDIYRSVKVPAIDSRRLLVASCSDDRTINAWDISPVLDLSEADELQSVLKIPRLASEIPKDLLCETVKSAPVCLAQSWAHTSRIWQIAWLVPSAEQSHTIRLLSGGEDATCQMWKLVPEPVDGGKHQESLYRLSASTNHAGKNIWSIALCESSSTKLATGGADGGITMLIVNDSEKVDTATAKKEWEYGDTYNNKHGAAEYNAHALELAVPMKWKSSVMPITRFNQDTITLSHLGSLDYDHGCPPLSTAISFISNSIETRIYKPVIRHALDTAKNTSKPGNTSDSFKAYRFINHNSWMLITRQGQLWSGHLDSTSETHVSWKFITQMDDLKSCSITAAVPSLRMGFLATAGGKVYRYCDESKDITIVIEVDAKITGLFAQRIHAARTETRMRSDTANQSHAKEYTALLVSTVRASAPHLYFYRISKCAKPDLFKGPVTICLSRGDIATSMLYVSIPGKESLLFVGFRGGNVAKYLVAAAERSDTKSTGPVLAQTVHQAHKEDAVTAMIWHPDIGTSKRPDCGFLLTTGRDSTYAIHHFKNLVSDPFVDPTLVHRSLLPFGPNVEGAFVRESNGHLILYGFRSKHFVVYDETVHKDSMTVECGGAHRIWDYNPDRISETQDGGTFVWNQASKFAIRSWPCSPYHFVKRGGHGREIKACAVCPTSSTNGARSQLIATGAEDTDIRLFEYTSGASTDTPPGFCSVGIIRKHNTGLQQLRWSSDGRYLFSSGGSEEFFVWRIRKIPFVRVGIVCESSLPALSQLQDLRITAFDIVEEGLVRLTSNNVVKEAKAECFKITMVFSDSTMRVSHYVLLLLTYDLILTLRDVGFVFLD